VSDLDDDVPLEEAAATPGDAHTALEDLLAIIAHEMRAPLAVVCSAAETAINRSLEPEQLDRLLQVIRRNAELAMLLADRLGLARDVELEQFRLQPVSLDLAVLVAQTTTDLTPLIANDHDVRIADAVPVGVMADETSLREILFNLLLNAAKYSPDGSTIEVAVTGVGEQARLTVRDQGRGVAASDAERIFGKYRQVDQGSKGVGLGLFISRGLARANGGDLAVTEAPGGGCSFELSLPLRTLGSPIV
jgi:signal transduction histidine kinase